MKERQTRLATRLDGFTIPFAVMIISFVILPISALMVGLGILMSDQSKLQLVANSAALAALEEWSRNQATNSSSRAGSARTRAVGIVQKNSILSANLNVAYADSTPSGTKPALLLSFGSYFEEDPCPTGATGCLNAHPCGNSPERYPCFIPRDTGSEADLVNAAQVRLHIPITNKRTVFFANTFAATADTLSARATASSVSRCVAFLLDVSKSTVEQSHNPNFDQFVNVTDPKVAPNDTVTSSPDEGSLHRAMQDPAETPVSVDYPGKFALYNPSNFAFRNASVNASNACSNLGLINFASPERAIWCNMRIDRNHASDWPWNKTYSYRYPGSPMTTPLPSANLLVTNSSSLPFRSDYRQVTDDSTSARGEIWADMRTSATGEGPQPLTAFLDGFNSAIRVLRQQKSTQDRATVKAFVGVEIPPFGFLKDPSSDTSQMTSSFDLLLHSTNVANVLQSTTLPAPTPNFVSQGWIPLTEAFKTDSSGEAQLDSQFFPIPLEGIQNSEYTNIVSIIDRAIQQLKDPRQCPAGSDKYIVLATDGVMSCRINGYPDGDNAVLQDKADCPSDNNYNRGFREAMRQLTGEDLVTGEQLDAKHKSITQRLIESDIAFSVILSGKSVEPNFINTPIDGGSSCPAEVAGTVSKSCFMNFEEAKAAKKDKTFFNGQARCPGSACSDEQAYSNIPNQGYLFRLPNQVFGQMALETGGVFCPLQPLDKTIPYECKDNATDNVKRLCDGRRTVGSAQTVPVYELGLSEQAASCMFQAIGSSPFLLSEPQCRWDGTTCDPLYP